MDDIDRIVEAVTATAEVMGQPMKFDMVIDSTLTAPEMPPMLFGIWFIKSTWGISLLR